MILKKDQYVINEKMPDWGIGKVIDATNQDRAKVFFEYGGYRTFVRKKNSLTEVNHSEVNADSFAHISHDIMDEEKRTLYKDLLSSQKYFLQEFPDGFNGKKYHNSERDDKDEGHAFAIEILDQKSFEEHLRTEDYGKIIIRVLKVANKLNLLFPAEKVALRDGLKEEESQKQFAQSLYSLLYSADDFKDRFENWVRTLVAIGADKWTIASYFLFIVYPDKYMFVKPTITQAVADMNSYPIAYTPRLNWNTYNKILKFSEYLKQSLHKLEPKDMIDVQSFMWCIVQSGKEK